MSEIMLARSFDANKIDFPAEVSVKLDGVAADFYKTDNGWACQSRQGKPLPSTAHIISALNKSLKEIPTNTHIIGELTVVGVDDFKDAGGIIRRKEADERIVLNIYDCYVAGAEAEIYFDRVKRIKEIMNRCSCRVDKGPITWSLVRRVPVRGIVHSLHELQPYLDAVPDMMDTSALYEGLMIRSLAGPNSRYNIGKRSWNMMRYKFTPTLDLEVVRFEEATANKSMTFLGTHYKEGDGLNAVGRIVVLYKGSEIGVGPGTLTHVERRELWENYIGLNKPDLTGKGLIAEVEYMLDKSYEALRQPVFKRWRKDKKEASEEA